MRYQTSVYVFIAQKMCKINDVVVVDLLLLLQKTIYVVWMNFD